MTATAAPAAVRRGRAHRPEAWLWALAGAGEATLAVAALTGGHHSAGVLGHAVGWVAMVAVMAPLIAPNVRYAALRSPARVRTAVTVDVVTGWALVWAGAAVVLGIALAGAAGTPAAIALVTVVAAAWQYAPVKRRSLARCGRLLAPPLDRRRARRACHRHGVQLGRDCVLGCAPLMALMAVAGHDPLVAAACVGVAWYERRRRPHHDPATRETALVIAAIGATAFVVAVLP